LTAPPAPASNDSSINGYQLRLPIFEGPLDVLLRLIERNQLEITDVSLVEVTDQFLSYAADLPESSPLVLAEFTTIASRLLLLKSRSLLPSEPVSDEEIEQDDLTRQLLAYKAVRDAAIMLRTRHEEGYAAYRRPPETQNWGDAVETLNVTHASGLVRALRRCVARITPAPEAIRPRPVISLAEMTRRIFDRLRSHGRTRFSSLISQRADRHERVAGFVALLTLWKQRAVDLWQDERFAEIEIEPVSTSTTLAEQVADD
jgi:segregation and condensation protein A